MIISAEREEDRIAMSDLLCIIEIAAKQYEKSQDPRIEKHIQDLYAEYEKMREKVEHGDYTEADRRRRKVDLLLAKSKKFCV